jgi:hypothetical protein
MVMVEGTMACSGRCRGPWPLLWRQETNVSVMVLFNGALFG